MIAVEFFDRTPIENAISSLTTVPDKIIFIGDISDMKKRERGFSAFQKEINAKTEIKYQPIRKNNLNSIVEVLSKIVEQDDDIVFDLTGGSDLVLVAMGIVYQKYPQKNIQLQRFNIDGNMVIDCDNDGNVVYTGTPQISVEQNILLYGGVIRYDNNDSKTFNWNLTDDFVSDIKTIWSICKSNPGHWNSLINILEAINQRDFSLQNNTGLAVCAKISYLKHYLKVNKIKWTPIDKFLKGLENHGLIVSYVNDSEYITYTYKNEQVKKCLTKAGNALELKVFDILRNLKRDDDTLLFNDAMNGVYIDWDGELHAKNDTTKDTENEIDIMLMQGIRPIFISCKNGQVLQDELYKLETVANRFGGPYAKKILISTYTDTKPERQKYFEQRAKDMGISLIKNVHTITSDKALIKRFNEIIYNTKV